MQTLIRALDAKKALIFRGEKTAMGMHCAKSFWRCTEPTGHTGAREECYEDAITIGSITEERRRDNDMLSRRLTMCCNAGVYVFRKVADDAVASDMMHHVCSSCHHIISASILHLNHVSSSSGEVPPCTKCGPSNLAFKPIHAPARCTCGSRLDRNYV